MAVKTADLRHEGGMRFVARTGSGFEIALDSQRGGSGPRPIEMLAEAIGGCTGMDVASILEKKRQQVSRYAFRIEAVARAIELSATKYCAVSNGLAFGIAELHHRYVVISPAGATPVEGEAAVTGPGQELAPDEG